MRSTSVSSLSERNTVEAQVLVDVDQPWHQGHVPEVDNGLWSLLRLGRATHPYDPPALYLKESVGGHGRAHPIEQPACLQQHRCILFGFPRPLRKATTEQEHR
jgi:hypothetical protein